MSELTKAEKAWVAKVQRALNECPSNRLGFFTIGDADVSIFDKAAFKGSCLDDRDQDLAVVLEQHDLVFGESLVFPAQVEGVCGRATP